MTITNLLSATVSLHESKFKNTEAYEQILDAMDVEIQQALGSEKQLVKHAYYSTRGGLPINNLHFEAHYGRCVFVQTKHSTPFIHDGEIVNGGADYQSAIVENPTWLDVLVLANKMISTVNNGEHNFFEGIRSIGKFIDGAQVFEFQMGS